LPQKANSNSSDNQALDAEPPIASFLKSMLIGGGPVNAVVMLLDPSNLVGPSPSGTGIKIDFAEALGQNDECWRRLGLGQGLLWTPGRDMGRSA